MKYDRSMLADLIMAKKRLVFQSTNVGTLPNIDNFFSLGGIALYLVRHIYLCGECVKER